MKSILFPFLIFMLFGCSEKKETPSAIGEWAGSYEGDSVTMTFDSAKCIINYNLVNKDLHHFYNIENDTLFLNGQLFGKIIIGKNRLTIKKLPTQEITRDIDIIYLIDFERKAQKPAEVK